MKYERVKEGVFLSRPNRFIAKVLIGGREETVHVKNTGRLSELLTAGAKVFLQESDNPSRKTKFDLISVYKGGVLYNIDSLAPNKVFGEYIGKLFNDVKLIRPECKYNSSRFDFYVEYANKKAFIEVKGVTLEQDGVMLFPDAPTERGVKHINELCDCIRDGYEAYVVFVIAADAGLYFTPNTERHREFAESLKRAQSSGVKIIAFNCTVDKDSINIKDSIEVKI